MTAYVVWGMTLARQAGIDVKSDSLERAVGYVDKERSKENSYDAQAWMPRARLRAARRLAIVSGCCVHNLEQPREVERLPARRCSRSRRTILATAHRRRRSSRISRSQDRFAAGYVDRAAWRTVVDPSVIGTAHWGEDGSTGGGQWRSGSDFVCLARLARDRSAEQVDRAGDKLAGEEQAWRTVEQTRDTAIVVLTLNDYLRTSGELRPAVGYQLLVNGSPVTSQQITADEALSAPTRFAIPRELIRDGRNEVTSVRKSGAGPLYFSARRSSSVSKSR